MSLKIERYLQTNNIKSDKTGSVFQVFITKKEEIINILHFANSEHIQIYFNYSDKFKIKPKSQDTQYIFLIFNNFSEISEINIANRYVVVEPRVKAKYLDQILKKDNFTFLPFTDNNSEFNIGQMIFNNIIGENQAKTVDSILGLEVILPNGELIHTGSKTLKSVSGYDITSLYIGSQGIFGIVIKATLRIDPIISPSDSKKKRISKFNVQSGFNDEELKLLRKLKSVIDPENVLNVNYLI
ncbi:MAG: FAD-binding protein [Candidatus Helarchaeota archaeon]|nr:FAD-binding protein [Candidatus Helarchaeota archaeon]